MGTSGWLPASPGPWISCASSPTAATSSTTRVSVIFSSGRSTPRRTATSCGCARPTTCCATTRRSAHSRRARSRRSSGGSPQTTAGSFTVERRCQSRRPARRTASEQHPAFAHGTRSVQFEFAATAFDAPELNEFQARLEGFDREWSSWSSSPRPGLHEPVAWDVPFPGTGPRYPRASERQRRVRVRRPPAVVPHPVGLCALRHVARRLRRG